MQNYIVKYKKSMIYEQNFPLKSQLFMKRGCMFMFTDHHFVGQLQLWARAGFMRFSFCFGWKIHHMDFGLKYIEGQKLKVE